MKKKQIKKTEAKSVNFSLKKANILGVKVAITDEKGVIKLVKKILSQETHDKPFFVCTANPEFVMQAQGDKEFMQILNSADLTVADGVGLRLADSRLRTTPGRKIVHEIASSKSYRVFFLGGQGGVAKLMAQTYGGAWDEGEKNIRLGEMEKERVLRKINGFKPDVLFVAYGVPEQEKWIGRNLKEIKAKVVMGVGGSFDYLTGKAKLPPEWMSNIGLEWLWRLVCEPWRWKRQLRLLEFVGLVLKAKVSTG